MFIELGKVSAETKGSVRGVPVDGGDYPFYKFPH